jgi:hypothetical protein
MAIRATGVGAIQGSIPRRFRERIILRQESPDRQRWQSSQEFRYFHIIESEAGGARREAARPIGEKLRTLERLRDRDRAIKRAVAVSSPTSDPDAGSPQSSSRPSWRPSHALRGSRWAAVYLARLPVPLL